MCTATMCTCGHRRKRSSQRLDIVQLQPARFALDAPVGHQHRRLLIETEESDGCFGSEIVVQQMLSRDDAAVVAALRSVMPHFEQHQATGARERARRQKTPSAC